jgi:hypothetical protein
MVEPSNGLIIFYNYLWAREYDRARGEAAARIRAHRYRSVARR